MTGAPPPAGGDDAARHRAAYRRGLSAEERAAAWLRLHGYRILHQRYRTPGGEIDLVVRRGSTVAFVEVKARATLEAALEAVTARTRRRIEAAQRHWAAEEAGEEGLTFRFDIVAIVPGRPPCHLPNAYGEGE
ncbi:YraN family protein [Pseudoxanthobacter sp.]|uniref:YraN family protein n=1 Tax=Pseudoxanthobacter sp. TaxID=1925742 RepID=UPI002FDF134D